jgi:hypothetical protein
MGTDARQSSTAACGSGISADTGLSTTASVTENAGPVGEGAESSCSDAAQQRSASAWLTTRFDSSSAESDLCIGHGPSSEQQAMRASGVAIHPAQTPTWPEVSASVRRTTERRLLKRTIVKNAGVTRRCQIPRGSGCREPAYFFAPDTSALNPVFSVIALAMTSGALVAMFGTAAAAATKVASTGCCPLCR